MSAKSRCESRKKAVTMVKGKDELWAGVYLPVLPWLAKKSFSEGLPSCLKYEWNVGEQDTGEQEPLHRERRAGLGRHRVWPCSPCEPGPWYKQRGLKIILNLQSSVQENTGDGGVVLPHSQTSFCSLLLLVFQMSCMKGHTGQLLPGSLFFHAVKPQKDLPAQPMCAALFPRPLFPSYASSSIHSPLFFFYMNLPSLVPLALFPIYYPHLFCKGLGVN